MFRTGLLKKSKFSKLDREEFKRDFLSGMFLKDLAEKYGVLNTITKALGLKRARKIEGGEVNVGLHPLIVN